jgi:catechol 2,3-dioxygenase
MAHFPPSRFEHFGINVIDIDRMEEFYRSTFGFTVSDRGVRFNGTRIVFLTKSANDHHQFVLIDGRPPEAEYNNINQISFAFADLAALRTVYQRLTDAGTTDIMQINHGNAWSLYAKDPEGNPLELFVDSQWHTPQPCRGDLDILKPDDVILKETEELCRSRPGFATREEWSREMAKALEETSAA